jgi:hypothetical protein
MKVAESLRRLVEPQDRELSADIAERAGPSTMLKQTNKLDLVVPSRAVCPKRRDAYSALGEKRKQITASLIGGFPAAPEPLAGAAR